MATTTWDPDLGSLGAYCFGRCGVRRPEITAEHLADLAVAANLVLTDWSNSQPNLWAVENTSFPLVAGEASYLLSSSLLLLLDAYVTVTSGGTSYDRVIFPVSRSQYAAFPNKALAAPPTVYWFNRMEPPAVTLYPTPDANATYTLNCYGVIRDADAAVGAASVMDLPYRARSAFADALAAKLALSYAPDKFPLLGQVALASFKRLRAQENENVPLYITPGLAGYGR